MPISFPSTPEARNAAVGSSYLHCTMLTGQVQWKTNILVQGGHKNSLATAERLELFRYVQSPQSGI